MIYFWIKSWAMIQAHVEDDTVTANVACVLVISMVCLAFVS